MKSTSSQTSRLVAAFRKQPDYGLSLPHLVEIASGRPNGWVASISRRIFECRKALESEGEVVKSLDVTCNGVRHTAYKFIKKEAGVEGSLR